MREQDTMQWGWHSVEVGSRLTGTGSRVPTTRSTRSGSRRPASSPFGFHVEAPTLPGAGEFLASLPGAVELELPFADAPEAALSRLAPRLTAGLLGVAVALMMVIAVASPR
jgi:hypothetical protein